MLPNSLAFDLLRHPNVDHPGESSSSSSSSLTSSSSSFTSSASSASSSSSSSSSSSASSGSSSSTSQKTQEKKKEKTAKALAAEKKRKEKQKEKKEQLAEQIREQRATIPQFKFDIEHAEPRVLEKIPAGERVKPLWPHTPVVALADVEGRAAPEVIRNKKIKFICQYCGLPAFGYCMGWAVASCFKAASKKRKEHVQWVLMGQFGSIGCAKRWAEETRNSFAREFAEYIPLMLLDVYGCKMEEVEALKSAPNKTDLPPYSSRLIKDWQQGKISFDAYAFHTNHMYQPKSITEGPGPNLDLYDLQSQPHHCLLQVHGNPGAIPNLWYMTSLVQLLPRWFVFDASLHPPSTVMPTISKKTPTTKTPKK